MNEQFFTSLNGYKVKDEYAVHTYDTVADMKIDSKLKSGMHVKTKGYYSANDNGKGEYIIIDDNTLVADNGSIHDLTNGLKAILIIDNSINVEQFGAKGDNETDDSVAFQNALNSLSKLNTNKLMLGKNKTYFIDSVLTIFKDSIIDLNNSTVRGGETHLFTNFKSITFGWDTYDNYTGYNGNGNITIKNGTIKGGNISFIHAENIKLENLNLFETNNDHYLEICACKNYHVLNCNFKGMKEQASNRQYVEYVQIDSCDYNSFPWLQEDSATYDGTLNENLTVENCTFKVGEAPYNHMYTAIGNHVRTQNPHNGIYIKNNYFEGAEFRSIRLINMNDIIIDNNKFINTISTAISFDNVATNVKITNNYMKAYDETINMTAILFNNPQNDNRHSNIEILNNQIYSENTIKPINPSYCDNIKIAYNIVNTKRIGVAENTTNLSLSNNTILNNDSNDVHFILEVNNNNSIKYSDVPMRIHDTLTADGDNKIVTLLYPFTDYNDLLIEFGIVGSGSWQYAELRGYEYRKFIAGEQYLINILNVDGTQSIYRVEFDSENTKLMRLVLVSGTGLTLRQVMGKSI